MKHILDPRICSILDEPRGDRRAVPIMRSTGSRTGRCEPFLICACGKHGDPIHFYSATQCRECREKEMKCKASDAGSRQPISKSGGINAGSCAPNSGGNTCANGTGETPLTPSSPKESNVGKRMRLCDMPVGTIWRDGNSRHTRHMRVSENLAIQLPYFKWKPDMSSEREVLADPVIEVGDLVKWYDAQIPWHVSEILPSGVALGGEMYRCGINNLTIIEKGSK